jgi:hypothetical protein
LPGVEIIICDNVGMDVGPFVEVMRMIAENGKEYKYLLKIHSKKSLAASGLEVGNKWRLDLLDGLIGSPTNIDRILRLFEDRAEVGMIGPRGMLLSKTSRDILNARNMNYKNMQYLSGRLGVPASKDQRFFRGTMFWSRFKPIQDSIINSRISISDFENGHQVDETRAHAMERLLPAIIESRGYSLHQFDREMPRSIAEIKGIHAGKDVYVIGAGASCNFVPPDYFEGKVVIGINRVFRKYRCDYVIWKEHGGISWIEDLKASHAKFIASKWDSGNIKQGKQRLNADYFTTPAVLYFDHLENTREVIDLSVVNKDSNRLVVSYSTITTGIHLAAYLGAKNIIIVGHDCGTIDGREVFDGYNDENTITPWKNPNDYRVWLSKIEQQTIDVKNKIALEYGCNIVSLNPFINFGLEGHIYER